MRLFTTKIAVLLLFLIPSISVAAGLPDLVDAAYQEGNTLVFNSIQYPGRQYWAFDFNPSDEFYFYQPASGSNYVYGIKDAAWSDGVTNYVPRYKGFSWDGFTYQLPGFVDSGPHLLPYSAGESYFNPYVIGNEYDNLVDKTLFSQGSYLYLPIPLSYIRQMPNTSALFQLMIGLPQNCGEYIYDVIYSGFDKLIRTQTIDVMTDPSLLTLDRFFILNGGGNLPLSLCGYTSQASSNVRDESWCTVGNNDRFEYDSPGNTGKVTHMWYTYSQILYKRVYTSVQRPYVPCPPLLTTIDDDIKNYLTPDKINSIISAHPENYPFTNVLKESGSWAPYDISTPTASSSIDKLYNDFVAEFQAFYASCTALLFPPPVDLPEADSIYTFSVNGNEHTIDLAAWVPFLSVFSKIFYAVTVAAYVKHVFNNRRCHNVSFP